MRGGAVLHMDDAAAGKALAFQQVLHHLVVGVGVGAQALAVLQDTTPPLTLPMPLLSPAEATPIATYRGAKVSLSHLSVLNDLVKWDPRQVTKANTACIWPFTMYTKQPVGVDILFQQLRAWVIVPPRVGLPFFAMNSRAWA